MSCPLSSRNPAKPSQPRGVSVQALQLSKAFGNEVVFSNISFTVAPGEIFVIMGPSGTGKSVLLRLLMGLDSPTAGQILIDGLNASDPATRRSVKISFVFQSGALLNSLTVFDNLALYLWEHRLYDKKTLRHKVMRALEMLSLQSAAYKYPSELSGGMRKRVAVARAIVMEPQLILYDEPTSELDPIMATTIAEMIATLSQEATVTSIVVTHDRELALTIGDRVALMKEGHFCALDTPQGIRERQEADVQHFLHPTINLTNPRFRKNNSNTQ